MKVSNIILIQPPFVQLNAPYPSPYYLKSFLEKRGFDVTVLDHSIGLFGKIFSRSGLTRIFYDAGQSEIRDKQTLAIVERFFSEKELWLVAVERIVGFLRGGDHEWGHFLALANGCLPGGPRTDAFLAERDGNIGADETKMYATKLLDDLADFIISTVDPGFSLIRYAPAIEGSLNTGFRDFSAVRNSLDGYIMNTFYRPMLAEEWEKLEHSDSPFVLGLTIPFPGCLSGALVCAESAKNYFGAGVYTIAGGGFVNTELRFLSDPDVFDYFDYISFDRGYGSLVSVLEAIETGEKDGQVLYKTKYRSARTVISCKRIAAPADSEIAGKKNAATELEDTAARTNFPDYSGVDFSRYIYPVDDTNPMHRLWSDGHWLKAYLAHGCYWHSCAFCDVTLDYIRNCIPVDVASLFSHLLVQADQTGVRGIHFCDESAPISVLLEFALLNRTAGLPFSFWGNIRLEKDISPDTAAILASGGLIGVSAGLEVATESGFKRLGKGINLESAVRACAAFREAGILTHVYLIYGYWDESEQELVDSAETLRQLFANGLLDSAFWHKFLLTKHSRIYAEKQRGSHGELTVMGDIDTAFALNDLSFKGEEKSDKYTEGLERLLAAWMAGDSEAPVTEAFSFRVKTPSVSPDLVLSLLDSYAKDRDTERAAFPSPDELKSVMCKTNVLFLGSAPQIDPPTRAGTVHHSGQNNENFVIRWQWRLVETELKVKKKEEAEKLVALLNTVSKGRGLHTEEFITSLENIFEKAEAVRIWECVRERGLEVYSANVKKMLTVENL